MILKTLIASALILIVLVFNVSAQELNNRSRLLISFKSHGGPCFSLCVGAEDLTCCPAYSFTISGDGQVDYDGKIGVKVLGKKSHSISAAQVEKLVEEFYMIDFFSLSDSYDDHRIDHYNAVTIALTVGDRTKSIYLGHGQPDVLNVILRKVIEVSGTSKYTGRS